ncbi:MAG: DEAD/DEAH box helicase [Rhodospirillaceae bacterium]|jgi:superfamily II DNA/RNA helicase|nr:DEAD/DEAH box helicase [Rhodospirillaceae bacterium]MBT4589451.1 DEAD/DEAH box helicase [Rhodospirillaceae bacterium]MBT4937847.1 DEAD/DEAH box helicase [Rhodospirillaceae bacterium]MBT7269063.1 DEAD/DEAH box helicase [Rhodospirillaceae bacterium]
MSFDELGLSEEVLKAVSDAGYTEPTPIQEKAIPTVLMGRDILGCAQTGTGKTASFTLPMIDILANGRGRARMPRTLILEPTRELAAQVAENFDTYGKYNKLSKALIIGGSSMAEQSKLLDRGVDVLIATPGRLLDLFDRGGLLLSDVKILVIDEADRMLDMGFIPDVEKIVSVIPKIRQTLFFSATMPPEIKRLADAFLMNPKEITVARPATPGETITQGLLMVDHRTKRDLSGLQKKKRDALRQLIKKEKVKNALVFCNRKKDVDIVNKSFLRHGFNSATLHGDMVQSARMATMEKFKADEYDYLICSDVAARGLDIDDLSHVFNFDVPMHAEDYVHRIGRTGRAGKQGRAFSIAWKEDKKYIDAIEKLIGKPIPRITLDGQTASEEPAKERAPKEKSPEKPEEKSAEKAEEKAEAKKPSRSRASKNDEKKDVKKDVRKEPKKATPVKEAAEDLAADGWGEHMPAFLLRPVK